jgi:hypothetical protein
MTSVGNVSLRITQRCPDVQHLQLFNASLSPDSLQRIGTCYPAMRSLSLCLDTIRDADIINMLQRLRGLKALEFENAWNMTDATLAKIAELLPQLTTIGFRNCPNISVVGMMDIADRCRNLRTVCIDDCPLVTDDSYFMLAEKWAQLERLDIRNSAISDASVLAIHDHCKQLKTLCFDETPKIYCDLRANLSYFFPGVKFAESDF